MGKRNKDFVLDPAKMFAEAYSKKKKEEDFLEKPLDIISFAKKINKPPHPAQEIILKFFYAGSRFNENLRIVEEDIELIKSWDLPQPWLLEGENSKLNMMEKHIKNFKEKPNENYFTDLVLVLGRRSGKSWLTSLITVYEAYKILTFYDPKEFFKIDDAIWIINTAVSAEQAKTIVFSTVKEFVHSCPFFEGRIKEEKEDRFVFYSDKDLDTVEKNREKELKREVKGSVIIQSGNSNSAALRGHTDAIVIYDEMAHYVDSSNKASARAVYEALSPSTINLRSFGEGRNVSISSPSSPTGYFHDTFKDAKTNNRAIVFQMPSWNVNPLIKRSDLEQEFRKNAEGANAEYGAVFRASAGDLYIPHKLIEDAQNRRESWYKRQNGVLGYEYYMHIDPATKFDRYSVMIAHKEFHYNYEIMSQQMHIVEDYSFARKPVSGEVLDPDDIMDNYVLPLFEKFNIVSVSSDAFFSLEQSKKLKNRGIYYRELSYNPAGKHKIYTTMRDYFINKRIILCNDDEQLVGELKNITVNNRKVIPSYIKQEDDRSFPDDDLVDCLGGIIYSIIQGAEGTTRLPRMCTVYTGARR